ncbi:MAG: heme ABC exporter ATP-binding protein CcmA [Alphaproteobacteria bacterium]|nr:heme ABC exporter ATP-binding protein CcmA [Alphaproteobacteria bacterium]
MAAGELRKSFIGEGLACRRGERRVFQGVAFALAPGGALVLAGPNGSGKTSLLRLMAGLARPEQGRVDWDGAPIADDPAAHRARLHYVGHQEAVKLALSAEENLGFWAQMRGSAAGTTAALRRFRLDPRASWPARYLSAGERKRLALARLLASPVALWLLDEPTTGLDAESVEILLAVIAEHRRGGGCLAVATHAALPLPGARTLSLAGHTTWRQA